MSPCHLLLYVAVLGLIAWATPDILAAIGRALGGIGRLVKRHPAISLVAVWIAVWMVVWPIYH